MIGSVDNYYVLIGATRYGPMDKKQLKGVLNVAKGYIGGRGIYAIRKNREITLINNKAESVEGLHSDILYYRKKGYVVYWRND